ncbi:hypothetical protein GY45DRAFT_1258499, partial [Cubamyces sp. BRFM 1775]
WDMEYHRIMGYGCDFPLSQLGKRIFLWVIPGYGLREVCLKRESTVSQSAKRPHAYSGPGTSVVSTNVGSSPCNTCYAAN